MLSVKTESDSPKFEAVMNTLVDGAIMIDACGRISSFNRACEIMFGYQKDEVINQNISLLMPEPYRGHHDQYIQNYQSSLQPKIIGIGREVEGQRRDGSVFPMHLSVGEVKGDHVKDSSFVGIIRDLTEEYEAREQYERLQQQHFHLSRVSAMDQMGTTIAHELNQPLTAIMNYMDAGVTMVKEGEGSDLEMLSLVMEKSSEQAGRAAAILSRLRRFIETGDVEKRVASPLQLIETSAELIMPLFKNDNIRIQYEVEDRLSNILVSSVQIQQVLVNLIKNACEAMLDETEKVLTLKAYSSKNSVIICVKDTGKGLSRTDFATLYEPFASEKANGLGVGLSICRTIIHNHNGQLWAERNASRGSCFYISLPLE